MNRPRASALAVTALVLGCQPGRVAPESTPARQLQLALVALDGGDLPGASRHLGSLGVAHQPVTEVERRALLLGTTLALDPRNPQRNPRRGADLAAGYLASARDPVDAALGRFLYSVALDLGAKTPAPRTRDGGTTDLPRLAGPSLAERLLDQERLVRQLRDELARIQQTLKP